MYLKLSVLTISVLSAACCLVSLLSYFRYTLAENGIFEKPIKCLSENPFQTGILRSTKPLNKQAVKQPKQQAGKQHRSG